MKPINFPQSVKVLQKPSTLTNDECGSLPVWSDGKQCVSCWKPTFKERVKILFRGKVWLGVMSGGTQPAVFVSGENVFETSSNNLRLPLLSNCVDNVIELFEDMIGGFQQSDKRKHFFAGLAISLIVGIFFPLIGLLLAVIAGAAKEYWDSKGHGVMDSMDFIFTCIGAVCALPLSILIHNFIL